MYQLLVIFWAVATALFWRFADRSARKLRNPYRTIVRLGFAAFFLIVLCYALVPLSRPLVAQEPELPAVIGTAGYLWYPFVLQGVIGAAVLWYGWIGVRRLIRRARGRPDLRRPDHRTAGSVASGPPERLTRRQALQLVAAATPPLATAGLTTTAFIQRGDFAVRPIDVPLPDLPPDLDGLTLIHLSDIHYGTFFPEDALNRLADVVEQTPADAIVFTGDLIDRGRQENLPAAMEFLRRISLLRPLVMVEGNHDTMLSAPRFEAALRDAGLPLLLDAEKTLAMPGRTTAIQFMGITWGPEEVIEPKRYLGEKTARVERRWDEQFSADAVRRLVELRRPDAFPILLAHHPHTIDSAQGLPLVLSGHTHGGQLMLTDSVGAGPLRFKYWRGVHRVGNSTLVISNGIGAWFPLRVNAPAELGVLRLVRQS